MRDDADIEVCDTTGQTFISEVVYAKDCRMQCLLTRFNHRKINFHKWFFTGFCPNVGLQYAFTTDCGAILRENSVDKLINHLSIHQECVAVTGRQRVMKESSQRVLGQVRQSEERSDELETQTLAPEIAHARTSVQEAHPP